jgi:hypothetical protein
VDPVVDKRKSVVKLWATAVVVHGFSPRPEGLELAPKGIVHKSIGR